MHADQASQFKSPAWKALADSANTTLVLSGIASHNALCVGERYHSFLRLIYRKIRMAHPGLSQEVALSMATAAMNQTTGPRGLVPTLLVFGVIPRMPVTPLPLPARRDRVLAMVTARNEMVAQVARVRVRTALAARVPVAADREVAVGMQVMAYREPPVDQCEGPCTTVAVKEKTVWLAIDGQLKQFGVDKVKPYTSPLAPDAPQGVATPLGDGETAPPGPPDNGASPDGGGTALPAASGGRGDPPPEPPPQGDGPPPTTSAAPDATPAGSSNDHDYGQMLDSFIAGERFLSAVNAASGAFVSKMLKAKFSSTRPMCDRSPRGRRTSRLRPIATARSAAAKAGTPARNYITVVVPPTDPRTATERFQASTWKGGDNANILSGRFVHTLKNVDTAEEMPKSRFVVQGNRDKAKALVVHNLETLRQRSTRLLVSTAAILGLQLFADDITQAYLQSEESYSRRIYLRPRPADRHYFGLKESELLPLIRPLYGICDAGDYWHATMTGHVEGDLGMRSLTSDPALFVKWGRDGHLIGLLAAFVDDLLMAGNKAFQKKAEATLRRFEAKKRKYDKMQFVVVSIGTDPDNPHSFTLDQPVYTDRLATLPSDATFKVFTSARASLAWLAHTRPDLCCGIKKLGQVREEAYDAEAVRDCNAMVRRAKGGRDLPLCYPPLDRSTLRMRAYADASFAGNDLSSQMGYVIILCDATGRGHILSYSSRKRKRVVRSAMAGEFYALTAALDEAFVLRYDLEMLHRRHIPLTIYTDSRQAFDVVTRATHLSEKRPLIDISGLRESYNRREISNLALVTTENNIGDAMTKVKCGDALDCFLKTGIDATPVAQWVVRPPVGPPGPTTGDGGV